MAVAQIYLILGPAGAGRRVVLTDLMRHGLEAEARPVLLLATTEEAAAEPVLQGFAGVHALERGAWSLADGRFAAEFPPEATHVFIMADGRANPVDQVEAFHAWLSGVPGELARVITIVDCKLGSEHPEVLRWYDACVHFSDVVLLNRREGVPNKWVSDFIARYRKQHYPCLIEFVKRGEVANPALILEPQARRISLLFDEHEPVTVAVSESDAADDFDDETAPSHEVVEDDAPPVDPYLERLAGSGRRAKEIPDIAKFL